MKLGLWGVVFFLVGMAPLADADGFFARLIKVCAALLLLRVRYDSTLWSELAELLPLIRTRTLTNTPIKKARRFRVRQPSHGRR